MRKRTFADSQSQRRQQTMMTTAETAATNGKAPEFPSAAALSYIPYPAASGIPPYAYSSQWLTGESLFYALKYC